MTLSKQMTLLMIIALSTIFISTYIITVHHSKAYYEEQLDRNAQDTATALGLSLSKQSANKKMDSATMLGTVNAVFDRGYFSSILIRDTSGKTLIKRYLNTSQHSVPNWFVVLIKLRNEEKTALIMNGWQQIGEVVVKSDNKVVYLSLWQTAKKLCLLFLLTTLAVIILSLFFIRALFKPLDQIVEQAADIGRKKFYILEQKPKTKELRKLSTTMNSMVKKVETFFNQQITEIERLRAQTYQDSLTGKGNRRYFFQQFSQFISSETDFLPGFLFLIELSGLAEFNQHHGYQEGDQVILEVSEYLDELFCNQHILINARLDGPSFAVVVLEQDRRLIESLLYDMDHKLRYFIKNKDQNLSCHVGVVGCEFGESPSNLLAKADKIVKAAQIHGEKNFVIEPEHVKNLPMDTKAWRNRIKEAIQNKTFHFYSQPVKSKDGVYQNECFIKLLSNESEISARFFFPIVEQYALGGEIDRLVLHEIAKIDEPLTMAINLSSTTINDENTQKNFLALVKKVSIDTKIKIHFEFSEFLLTENMAQASSFIESIVSLNHVIGLDRVGATLASLGYLKKLNITYLKLDGSLLIDIEKNKLKQNIITHWISTTQNLDIILIATAVESESQWRTLKQLGITYFQGNYIQSPSLIKIE